MEIRCGLVCRPISSMPKLHKNNFWRAVSILVGSTVGVGVFGVPFVFAKAGLVPGFGFLIGLTIAVLILNLAYGEIVLRTEGRHLLMGYGRRYLSPVPRRILLLSYMLGMYGALLSYIIVSGTFISNFLSIFFSSSPILWSILFFFVVSALLLKGITAVSRFDFMMLIFFLSITAVLIIVGFRHVDLRNYLFITNQYWFLPFGVILFALSGLSAVPLVREVLGDDDTQFRRAVSVGTLIPAFVYGVFALIVVGISGEITSPDALSGLSGFLGDKIVIFGSLFGALAITTSFLGLGLALTESLQYDFKFTKVQAWLVTIMPPFLLFISGLRDFINVIGLVGGFALSLEGIFVLLLYIRAKQKGTRMPEYSVGLPRVVIYILMLVFGLGVAYTLIN